jgi:hypothetical protein
MAAPTGKAPAGACACGGADAPSERSVVTCRRHID